MKNHQSIIIPAAFLLLFILVGCNDMRQLSGRVTFSDDGTPLTTGSVCFESDTYAAYGKIREDGTYTMGSLKQDDGLPPGTYKVYITGAYKKSGVVNKSGVEEQEPLVDKKFADNLLTELRYTVDGSNLKFDFQVDRPQAKSDR